MLKKISTQNQMLTKNTMRTTRAGAFNNYVLCVFQCIKDCNNEPIIYEHIPAFSGAAAENPIFSTR